MSIIERKNKFGVLYISDKNLKIALNYNGELISDQSKVWDIIEENRIPVKAQFEITEKCNFNCYYCYAKNLRKEDNLITEQVKKVIDKLYEMGVVIIELTGGEPLVREDFIEIIRYINEKEFIISMITNSSNFNEDIIGELEKCRVSSIRVSLLALLRSYVTSLQM